jgi:hypothetical protein
MVRAARIAVVAVLFALLLPVGQAGAVTIGDDEGCTPGYWKNHAESWEEYQPGKKLGDLWNFPASLSSFEDVTMLQALDGGGGPGVSGATKILMRAAVAAYLNAAHDGIGYPYRRFTDPFNIELQVNNALASEDRDTILALATTLDNANNLGCPLN